MATGHALCQSITLRLIVLLFAASGCGRLAGSNPTPIPSPASTVVPSATSRPPTLTPVVPAPTTARSTATVSSVPTRPPITAPTSEPTTLAPSVLSAVDSFRAEVPNGGPPSRDKIARAQAALQEAAVALVSSGDAADQRLRAQFARALTPDQTAEATVASIDLDADGKADLVVSVPVAGLDPVIVPGGTVSAKPLLPMSGAPNEATADTVTTVSDIRDLSGSGRPNVVVTRVSQGASSLNTELIVISWDGQKSVTIFHQVITDWAGPATWKIVADGTIEITCPAFGVYDHKLLPHPQQTRFYRWNGSSLALVARRTDPPRTKRQMMNLAESDFFAGDRTRAVLHYQSVINDARLADEPGDAVDWVNFARFRLGEIAALSGNQPEAVHWLTDASRAKPALGPVASQFLQAERAAGAAAGFATVQRSDLPTLFERGQMGSLGFPVTIGPFAALGQGIAASLDRIDDFSLGSATRLADTLTGQGYQVENVVVADFDGDGTNEIAMVVPFGSHEQTLWLFDHSSTGWRAIATVPAPRGLDGIERMPDGNQAIRILAPTGTNPAAQLLTWNGGQVAIATSPTSDNVPVATNFESAPGDCGVAEDLGGP